MGEGVFFLILEDVQKKTSESYLRLRELNKSHKLLKYFHFNENDNSTRRGIGETVREHFEEFCQNYNMERLTDLRDLQRAQYLANGLTLYNKDLEKSIRAFEYAKERTNIN